MIYVVVSLILVSLYNIIGLWVKDEKFQHVSPA